MNIRTIDGRTWTTPLTRAAPRTVGTARLRLTHYRGAFPHEGIGGYEFWRTGTWLPVVMLQQKTAAPWAVFRDGYRRGWQQWMVDDPVHWDGMAEAVADLPGGAILVAGLGLGLMLHHMATQPRFTTITVVEINPDVVELIRPTLPPDPRVELVVGDFYQVLNTPPPVDGVLWDLAVGKPRETFGEMMLGQALVRHHLGATVPLVQFGIRRTPPPASTRRALSYDTKEARR